MCADSIGSSRSAPISFAVSATMRIAMAAPAPRAPEAIAASSLVNVSATCDQSVMASPPARPGDD
jgi:hypothetical protein